MHPAHNYSVQNSHVNISFKPNFHGSSPKTLCTIVQEVQNMQKGPISAFLKSVGYYVDVRHGE